MQRDRTAIVIVNWNGVSETRACLSSIEAIRAEFGECIVVENASIDGSAAAIRREFPWVRLIETGSNLGYAGGNNCGIRAALADGADAVLVLNNDTIAHPGLVREMRSALNGGDPRLGVVGPRVLRVREPERFWYAGGRIVRSPFRARHVSDPPASERPYPVDYVPGCALLASREALEAIGPFDERFFLTWEDADLCARAQDAGFGCAAVPAAAIEHAGSVSFEGLFSPLYSYYYFRNMLLFAKLHFSWPARARAYRETVAFARATVRAARPAATRRRLTAAVAVGLMHFACRRFGPGPAGLTRDALEARLARSAHDSRR